MKKMVNDIIATRSVDYKFDICNETIRDWIDDK